VGRRFAGSTAVVVGQADESEKLSVFLPGQFLFPAGFRQLTAGIFGGIPHFGQEAALFIALENDLAGPGDSASGNCVGQDHSEGSAVGVLDEDVVLG